MPERRDIFINQGIYHVFSRFIDHKRIFSTSQNASNFLGELRYYRSLKANISYSRFKELPDTIKNQKQLEISFRKYFRVDILGFCLMPTHYHLLLQQITDNGIIQFMSNVSNSFTRLMNIKSERKGPLFLPRFHSRAVLSDEQLIHVSRYIHLNPYSAELIKNINDLEKYPLSSYCYYISAKVSDLVNISPILDLFNKDKHKYQTFVENQADYQKTLEDLKYVAKW